MDPEVEPVTYSDIEYYPSKCILDLGQYQIYEGTWDEDDFKIPAAIICINETNREEDMEDEQAYIERNFDQICHRERDARRVRSGFFHQNLHAYHKIKVDSNQRRLYIAAELIVCNLMRVIRLPEPLPANYPVRHEGDLIKYTGPGELSFEIKKKKLMRQISNGVAHFHGLDRIHRNLTPDNIFIALDRTTKKAVVKISAFFLSKQTRTGDSTASFSGTRTRGWSPREMHTNETERVGKQVDVFSLGCIFHCILTGGQHPFDFSDRNIKSDKFKPRPLASTPSNESVLVARMISHSPLSRPDIEEVKRNPALRNKPYYLLYSHDNGETKPGLCVIFNQMEFYKGSEDVSKLPHRRGSIHDEIKLRTTFTQFGFDVKTLENKTAAEIREEVNKLNAPNVYQSIVLCFLSHGDETGIFGVDGESVSYGELPNFFASSPDLQSVTGDPQKATRHLSTFHGKPKIFLYQACRGNKSQLSIVTGRQAGPREHHAAADQGHGTSTSQTITSDPLGPALADCLEVYATIKQYKAYLGEGSIFIQTLCDELLKQAGKQDFKTVAESLNVMLQDKFVPDIDEATNAVVLTKQVISVDSSLRKRLQLEKQVSNCQKA